MWAEGDDLSVITDNDETGFRVVEYGKNRKVVLPDSLKSEIKETRLQRELRRRGIGQHTIEKALRGHVRAKTFRRILEAIDAYRKEQNRSEDSAAGRAISHRRSIRPHRRCPGGRFLPRRQTNRASSCKGLITTVD